MKPDYAEDLIERMKRHAVSGNKEAMEAYMKNQFTFLGIKAPERKRLLTQYAAENGWPETNSELKVIVHRLFLSPYRECVYAGIDLLIKKKKLLKNSDLDFVMELIVTKPWWDTVDLLASHIAGYLIEQNPCLASQPDRWIKHESMWVKRTALLYQLKYKEKTNKKKLAEYICSMSDSNEFFIQKAIGWALREYSKTDPDWVIAFTSAEELKPLSRREALKYVNKIEKGAE
ncbi:DNA alkylation repair protein [Metabacillus sp. FJAT-52054]|uniref:DNA alkylation repair protein n=1 Tax=Metabacillus sediminis TaxID=3117746 RepID=A0ABZ2NEP0_9BACI